MKQVPALAILRRRAPPTLDQAEMGKRKRKLTAAENAEKKRRKAEFRTVLIGGKQKRVRRPPTIDGMEVEEFIRRNADPAFLHEMEMWELMEEPDSPEEAAGRPLGGSAA